MCFRAIRPLAAKDDQTLPPLPLTNPPPLPPTPCPANPLCSVCDSFVHVSVYQDTEEDRSLLRSELRLSAKKHMEDL